MDRSVSGMHQVCLVLKQVVDGLNDVSFTQHNSILHGHELVFHFSFKSMHKMYALVEETLEESCEIVMLEITKSAKVEVQ